MRTLNEHGDSVLNSKLTITVMDEPGPGGAHHDYELAGFAGGPLRVRFQIGGIAEQGANGVSNEALLVIVLDRLRSFQKGPFACRANGAAIEDIEYALSALESRTLDRVARGVEGKTIL